MAPLDLSAVAWWLIGDELRIGVADGTVSARIATEGMWVAPTNVPIVRGPVGGVVLYGRTQNGGIELHLVAAATGEDRSVARIPATVEDVEMAPSGTGLYWIDGSAADGGVWRLDVASGQRSRMLAAVHLAAQMNGTVLAAVARPRAQLALNADGSRLAALWCSAQQCLLQVIRIGDDAIDAMRLTDIAVELLGFAGDRVSLGGSCADVRAQTLAIGDCPGPDAAATAASFAINLAFGVELPPGWGLDVVQVPDAEPMSFELQAVAVPVAGGDAVLLEALGVLHGQ